MKFPASSIVLLALWGIVIAQTYPALINATLEELVTGLEDGMFTSVDLVNAYVARIKEVNSTLHMVTELNPDALAIAATLDKQRANDNIKGMLHGIPILIKNNIATKDKMNNTAGSFALLGAKVPRDSTMAAKLRKAGAIILGKTNLSQWANFRSDNTSNGWSAYGGQTFAAYHPKQDPSGSSSGSGVAASLGLALAALGTETDGSIVSPAQANNLVGIKPSVGLTSRHLVIPISEHQDTVGPMARTVKDAAYLLQAIAGIDPLDNYTSAIPNNGALPDYVGACDYFSLRGARIGVPYNVIEAFQSDSDAPILVAFNSTLQILQNAGAKIIEANFTALPEFIRSNNETIVLDTDFVSNLFTYLSELTYNPTGVQTLADVRKFTIGFKQEDYPSRDVGIWDESLALGYNNTDYRAYKAYQADQYLGGQGGLLGALKRHNLDAIVLPTAYSSSLAAIVGAPIVTVPMGFYPENQVVIKNQRGNLVDVGPNVPFGLSFLGARFTEAQLIGFAYAYEQRTHIRDKVQPYLQAKTEIMDVV